MEQEREQEDLGRSKLLKRTRSSLPGHSAQEVPGEGHGRYYAQALVALGELPDWKYPRYRVAARRAHSLLAVGLQGTCMNPLRQVPKSPADPRHPQHCGRQTPVHLRDFRAKSSVSSMEGAQWEEARRLDGARQPPAAGPLETGFQPGQGQRARYHRERGRRRSSRPGP